MRDMIESIARSIVADETSLELAVEEGLYQTSFTLRAAGNDVGKLVGRKGRTIGAIRNLLDLAAEQTGTLSLYNVWVESGPSQMVALAK